MREWGAAKMASDLRTEIDGLLARVPERGETFTQHAGGYTTVTRPMPPAQAWMVTAIELLLRAELERQYEGPARQAAVQMAEQDRGEDGK